MLREIQEVQNLATKYSKAELGRMVQMGLIDPQKAMMAGMMIERIQQQNAQPPQTTVAQDILGMAPQQGQPQQMPMQGQPPMPPQGGMPPPQMPPQDAPQGMADGGITNLYTGDVGNYADGGIVAFAGGSKKPISEELGPPMEVVVTRDPKTEKPPEGSIRGTSPQQKTIQQLMEQENPQGAATDKGRSGKKQKNAPPAPGRWEGTYETKYDDFVEQSAKKYGVDPKTMWRLLYTESSFNPKATSYAGKKYGYGIAQISHHHKLTDKQMEDPKFAIDYATKYFSNLLEKSGGDYRKALEKYKGVATEGGRQRMASAINKVLGSDPVNAPIVKPSKLKPLKPGETASYPVPAPGVEVKRLVGQPTFQEMEERKRALEEARNPKPKVKPVGEPVFLQEEYNQDRGGMFYPEDVINYPEFFSKASGGIISLAGGGVGSMMGGMPPPNNAETQNTLRLMEEARERDRQETEARKAAYAKRLETIRQKMAQGVALTPEEQTIANYNKLTPSSSVSPQQFEAWRNASQQIDKILPPIASPAQQGTQQDFTDKSLPPVEVTANRIPVGASPSLVQNQPTSQGPTDRSAFGLPGIETYRKKMDLQAELPPIPEKGDAEKELESARALHKKAGYDEDFYNNMIAKIEERKGDRASEKDRAVGEAIMQAGFKLMGARRGEGFQALSEGAQEGLMSYQKAMRDYQNRLDKLDERTDAFRIADAQARRTGADAAIAAAQKQNELRQKAEEKAAEAKNQMASYAAKFAVDLRDTDAKLVTQAMANKTAKEIAQIRAEDSGSVKNTLPAIVNSAIDDWNKMDITQRKNMEKNQGIKTDQDYVNYRLRMLGLPPVSALPSSNSGWGELKVTGGK